MPNTKVRNVEEPAKLEKHATHKTVVCYPKNCGGIPIVLRVNDCNAANDI
jgi:hypothetical protein